MKKTLFTAFAVAAIAANSLLFQSCDGFSKSGRLKQEIENEALSTGGQSYQPPTITAETPEPEQTTPHAGPPSNTLYYDIDSVVAYGVSDIIKSHPGHEGGEYKDLLQETFYVIVKDTDGDTLRIEITAFEWYADDDHKKIDHLDQKKFTALQSKLTSANKNSLLFHAIKKAENGKTTKDITGISLKGKPESLVGNKYTPAVPPTNLWSKYDDFRIATPEIDNSGR